MTVTVCYWTWWFSSWIYPARNWCKRLPEGKPPLSYNCPMVFPSKPPFSYGFPMVFPWKPPFSYGFPMVFLWFSHENLHFPMVFLFPWKLWFSYGFPMVFQKMPTCYPLVHQGIPSPDPRYPRCHVAELPGGLPRRIFAEAKTQLVGLVSDRQNAWVWWGKS